MTKQNQKSWIKRAAKTTWTWPVMMRIPSQRWHRLTDTTAKSPPRIKMIPRSNFRCERTPAMGKCQYWSQSYCRSEAQSGIGVKMHHTREPPRASTLAMLHSKHRMQYPFQKVFNWNRQSRRGEIRRALVKLMAMCNRLTNCKIRSSEALVLLEVSIRMKEA